MFFVVYYFYLEVFYYEGFDDMSFYVWMHQCFNTYVLILLFYGVLNVWLIVDLPRVQTESWWASTAAERSSTEAVQAQALKLSIKAIVTVKVTSWARR